MRWKKSSIVKFTYLANGTDSMYIPEGGEASCQGGRGYWEGGISVWFMLNRQMKSANDNNESSK